EPPLARQSGLVAIPLAGLGEEALDLALLVAQRRDVEHDLDPPTIGALEGERDPADLAFEELLGDELDDVEADPCPLEQTADRLVDGLAERNAGEGGEGVVRPLDHAGEIPDRASDRLARRFLLDRLARSESFHRLSRVVHACPESAIRDTSVERTRSRERTIVRGCRRSV